MDEDLFSVKAVKSFRTAHSKFGNHNRFKVKDKDFVPLTTKNAVKFLLEGSLKYRVCRYCLNVVSYLSELDEIFEVARNGAIYNVTIRDMIACIHPFKVVSDPNFPDKICSRCVENAINSYLFSQQCERSERALRNCFSDIYEKFEKLDPVERTKKRGRQKINPNPNILYTEHETAIDYAEPIINIVNVGANTIEDDTRISKLECAKCWQVLPDVESLLNHESLHPKTMWYSCRLCGKCFVKHRQYNRHVKEAHHQEQVVVSKNSSFRCNYCGVVSGTLSEHLQHIEKHKFKTTFKHLINRTMDRLCTVCLEKDSSMISLNETIHMHGGYPELHNDMSIYNIVSSTFPERKSYKYQELLIPTKASIMTIRKRRNLSDGQDLTAIYHKDKNMFHFCSPTILPNIKFNFDTHDIFILSEPQKLDNLDLCVKVTDDFQSNKLTITNPPTIANSETNEVKNSTNININLDSINDSDKIFSTHEENSIDEENTQSKSKSLEEENKFATCKTCWIFNKPSCPKCIANINLSDTIDSQYKDNSKSVNHKKCNYCWLFENVNKCDYCMKEINVEPESDNVVSSNKIELKKAENIEKRNEVKDTAQTSICMLEETDLESNMSKESRKRKSNLQLPTPKSKWQCRICLTNNNKNRQTCFCCEFDSCLLDNKVKFNFGMKKSIFQMSTNDEETPELDNKEVNVDSKLANKLEITNYEVAGSSKENDDLKLPKEVATAQCIPKPDSIEDGKTSPMDIDVTSYETVNNFIDNDKFKPANFLSNIEESMDVSFENSPTNMAMPAQNFNTSLISDSGMFPHQNIPFQFTMGSGNTDTNVKNSRRRLKPLRRMANMGGK